MKTFESRFLFIFFPLLFLILFLLAAFNFVVDPGDIYLKKASLFSENKLSIQNAELSLFNSFERSKVGLAFEGNERVFSNALAKHKKNMDCVILGSSRAMQISSIRSRHLNRLCTNTLNLGVSGGSLEDIFIYVQLLTQNNNLPRIVFIEVSPWTLKWNMDIRFLYNADILSSFLEENRISKPGYTVKNYKISLLKNLINLEYTKASLLKLYQHKFKLTFLSDTAFLENLVYSENIANLENMILTKPVRIKDGSLVYQKSFTDTNKTGLSYNEPPAYNLSGPFFEDSAVDTLSNTIEKLGHRNVEIYLVLTPYHESSFRPEHAAYSKYLIAVEKKTREIARTHNIKLLGSYSPSKVGCRPEQFYDFMHPTSECVDLIFK